MKEIESKMYQLHAEKRKNQKIRAEIEAEMKK
jgi:hypothetical protein